MICPTVAAMATRTASWDMSFATLGNSIFPSASSMWYCGSLPVIFTSRRSDPRILEILLAQLRLWRAADRAAASAPAGLLRRNGRALWRSGAGRGEPAPARTGARDGVTGAIRRCEWRLSRRPVSPPSRWSAGSSPPACAGLWRDRPVVDDQVDDLLLRQAGIHTEAREGQIVPALALVLQIVPLAVPGVPEPHVVARRQQVDPASIMSSGMRAFEIDDQGLVREPLGPLARRLLLRFRIGDRRVVQELLEVREVVAAVGQRVERRPLSGCAGSLRLLRAGMRSTRARSESRS